MEGSCSNHFVSPSFPLSCSPALPFSLPPLTGFLSGTAHLSGRIVLRMNSRKLFGASQCTDDHVHGIHTLLKARVLCLSVAPALLDDKRVSAHDGACVNKCGYLG